MIGELERFIISHWEQLPTGGRPQPPTGLDFLLSSKKRKVILQAMPKDESHPSLIIKVARDESYDHFVIREYENLLEVSSMASIKELTFNLPLPIHFERINGRALIIQPYFQGKPLLWNSYDSNYVLKAAAWITDFHSGTVRSLSETQRRAIFLKPLEDTMEVLKDTPDLCAFLEEVGHIFAQASSEDIKAVFAHRDFTEDNLLFDDEKLYVIDWEFGQYPGPPVIDLIGLLVRSNMNQQPGGFETSFQQLLQGEGEGGALHQSLLKKYFKTLGVNYELLPIFFALFLSDRINLLRSLNITDHKEEALINCLTYLSARRHILAASPVSIS